MRSKAFAAMAVVALAATLIVPLATQASFTDSVFILGKWNHEETETSGDDTYESVTSLRFEVGGGGKSIYKSTRENDGYTSESQYESEFEWKIEGDILYIYFPPMYADSKADPDWDAATQYKIEFESAFSKLKLYQKTWTGEFSSEATDYEKSGSVCGVCCPCAFMYFAIAPVTLLAVFAVRRLRE